MKVKFLIPKLSILITILLLASCNQDNKAVTVGKSENIKMTEQPIIWGESRNGLVLGIQGKKSEWVTDETAEFTVHLKNEGKTTINLPFFFFGLSALQLDILNDKGESISFMKENLSTEVGESISISPKKIISTSQQVVLSKENWEGSTGNYQVIATYDTTDYKNANVLSSKWKTETLVFTVK